MARFRFWVDTNMRGSERTEEVEIPDDDLEGLEGGPRDSLIWEYLDDWVQSNIHQGWEEISDQ